MNLVFFIRVDSNIKEKVCNPYFITKGKIQSSCQILPLYVHFKFQFTLLKYAIKEVHISEELC